MTTNRKLAILLAVWALVGLIAGYAVWRDRGAEAPELPPVSEEVPSESATTTPPPFDDTGAEDKSYLIRVETPKPGDKITSPLTVKGVARGNWYFEASFPVRLEDGNGKVLAQHYAQAEGEWMTTEFVPFTSTFAFDTPTSPTGTLILMKDNPSGLPEHDDELRILVRFDTTAPPPTSVSGCRRTGCSGQVCADEDVITDCAMRPEYVCYRDAECERQANGSCGWTQSAELIACLTENASPNPQPIY